MSNHVSITPRNTIFQDKLPSSIPTAYLAVETIKQFENEGCVIRFIVEPNTKGNLIPIREPGRGRFLCVVCIP